MITPRQEEWLSHLSNEKRINIVPFDPTAEEKFLKLKTLIQSALGPEVPIEHRGSTSLGISGQDEIDVYIPVSAQDFPTLQRELAKLFGEPRSNYELVRTRFKASVDGKRIDLFLINKEHEDWLRGVAFEALCRTNPSILESYRILKEEMNGWTSQDFYRRKIEFINAVLEKGKSM